MAVAFALASALLFALAAVLQQRAASEVPEEHALRPGLLWRLVRKPLWLAGTVADWVGFGFQALALGVGSLLVVQPLLCAGLLFALPLAAHWAGRRLSRRDWAAAVALTGGLAIFLLVGDPAGGKDTASVGAWLVTGALVVPVIAGCTVAGMRARGATRAVLIALATAVLYSVTAVLTKSAMAELADGLDVFFTSWEPYVGVAAGVVGLLLNQTAFQAGDLEASLPTLTAGEPVLASVLGVLLLDEQIQAHGAPEWILVTVAIATLLWGVVVLAMSAARAEKALTAGDDGNDRGRGAAPSPTVRQ